MSESLRDILVGLWKRPTERDLQRLVGPSNISNPCSRCLAEDMLQHEQPESQYTMGAKIGTAIHSHLEEEALKRPDLTPETKVTIAEVEGYGIIKGTSDQIGRASCREGGECTGAAVSSEGQDKSR